MRCPWPPAQGALEQDPDIQAGRQGGHLLGRVCRPSAPSGALSLLRSLSCMHALCAQVKLVGSTISCEPFFESADKSKDLRQNPHVQSYVVATDKVHHSSPIRELLRFARLHHLSQPVSFCACCPL